MDINRNQFFMIGLVVLFIGVQLRLVDSFVLNEPASRFIAQRLNSQPKQAAANTVLPTLEIMGPGSSTPLRTVKPPVWLGWALMSAGSVLILHSLAMKRP
jgi:hypothetical protein